MLSKKTLSHILSLIIAVLLPVAASAAPLWKLQCQSGTRLYFAFTAADGGANRLAIYDLAAQTWAPSVTLPDAPTAIHADESTLYIAYSRGLWTRNLDGTNEVAYYNSPNNINGILSDSQYLFVFSPSYYESGVTSLNKTDGTVVSRFNSYYSLSGGYSIDVSNRRIYGVNLMTSSFSTIELQYNTNGTFGSPLEIWSDTGSYYNEQERTYVRPGGGYLLRKSNRALYTIPGLSSPKYVGGTFDDATFTSTNTLLVLRDRNVLLHDANFLPTNNLVLGQSSKAIATYNGQLYAFYASTDNASGIGVQILPLSGSTDITTEPPLDPTTLRFLPDDYIGTSNDSVFMLSKTNNSIFEWSATTRSYIDSFRLRGPATHFALSNALGRLYTGYDSGAINEIRLDQGEGTERSLLYLPQGVRGLAAVGDRLFAADSSGAWETHYVISSIGAVLDSKDWSYFSTEYIWSPTQSRIYFFRDDSSPNDLLYRTVASDGKLGSSVDTPYHGGYLMQHPIRISPDESQVFTGGGITFKASDLTVANSISNTVTDAVYTAGKLVTIREWANATQVQVWNDRYLQEKTYSLTGKPLRLFGLSGSKVVVFTQSSGGLINSIVDLVAQTVSASPGVASVSLAGKRLEYYFSSTFVDFTESIVDRDVDVILFYQMPMTLSATAIESGVTYQWFKGSTPIPGMTSSTLSKTSLDYSDSGYYTVRVSNANGSTISAGFNVTVKEGPDYPVLKTPLAHISAKLGDSATFGVEALGQGLTYTWSKPSGEQVAGTNQLTLTSVAFQDQGFYSVTIRDKSGNSIGGGSAYLEVVDPNPTTIGNLSTRMYVGTGEQVGIAGFSIYGTANKSVLVRASGPGLGQFGVSGTLTDPTLTIYDRWGNFISSNDNWNFADKAASDAAGAFAWQKDSTDAMAIVNLAPGSYTAIVSAADGKPGIALVEVYELDRSTNFYSRLGNLSTRARVGQGGEMVIAGFSVRGNSTKTLMLRAAGPTLRDYGITTAIDDPKFVLFNEQGQEMDSNDNWLAGLENLFAGIGAFQYRARSLDAAKNFTLPPGNYTVHMSGVGGTTGTGLVEIYESY